MDEQIRVHQVENDTKEKASRLLKALEQRDYEQAESLGMKIVEKLQELNSFDKES